MELDIREQLYIRTSNYQLLQELKKILTFTNPDYAKKQAMGYSVWDVPIQYELFKTTQDGLAIPRGVGKLPRKLAEKYGEEISVTDQRTFNNKIDVSLNASIIPFSYQVGAIKSALQYQQGLIVAPCGAGKSIIGMSIINRLKQSTMIIVHTSELFQQWKNEISKTLHGSFTVGQIGCGKRFHGDITIAMIQTLIKSTPEQFKEIQDKYSITIWDESHHAGADSYIKCISNVRSKYTIGLTATPKRRDKKDFLITNYLGDVIHTITDADLEMVGRQVTCKVEMQSTGARYNWTKLGEDHGRYQSKISKEIKRNDIIFKAVCMDIQEGFLPMILTLRIFHASYLESKFKEYGFNVACITGKTPPPQRLQIKNDLKRGKYDLLIANKQIAAEGLDIPNISSVHICFWTTALGLIKQMIGRARRVFEDKQFCRVWFYYDYVWEMFFNDNTLSEEERQVPQFKSGIRRVETWFIEQGFEVNNGKEFINE